MDYRIKEILAEIEADLARRQTARQFAARLNVSVSRFQHLFKTEVEESFALHVKNLRLEKARELLTTSNLTVKEIAAQVGASDASHFLRDFKSKFGETPTEYRKRCHE